MRLWGSTRASCTRKRGLNAFISRVNTMWARKRGMPKLQGTRSHLTRSWTATRDSCGSGRRGSAPSSAFNHVWKHRLAKRKTRLWPSRTQSKSISISCKTLASTKLSRPSPQVNRMPNWRRLFRVSPFWFTLSNIWRSLFTMPMKEHVLACNQLKR